MRPVQLDPTIKAIDFTCNICGTRNSIAVEEFHRERAACTQCGSTPRFRGVVHALSMGLFGRPVPLCDFPADKSLRGIGMSDWEGYANPLTDKLSFVNTYLHMEPKLDIASEDWRQYQDLDFVICSEVLEHVTLPLEPCFRNLHRMLKPHGTLVISVPFVSAPSTVEHFSGLHQFQVQQFKDDQWIVVNQTHRGAWEVYDNLLFHGGPGSTLEMRVFAENDLLYHLTGAGFGAPVVYETPILDIGYYWPPLFERPDNPNVPYLGYIMAARAS